jgi:hypothetical protein
MTMETPDLLTLLGSGLISFLVAWATVRAEESKGRAALYLLCCRFFIAAFNTMDQNTKEIKNDPLSKDQYENELESILHGLLALSSNPYFVRFIARNEFTAQMLIQIRIELRQHRASQSLALNQGTIQHFIETFRWCKKNPWGLTFRKHKKTEELVEYFDSFLKSG